MNTLDIETREQRAVDAIVDAWVAEMRDELAEAGYSPDEDVSASSLRTFPTGECSLVRRGGKITSLPTGS